MQRAETLLPASTSGLTASSLRALSERHPFRDRLTGRVPPLVCPLSRSYLRSLCDRNFDSGILLAKVCYLRLPAHTLSIPDSHTEVELSRLVVRKRRKPPPERRGFTPQSGTYFQERLDNRRESPALSASLRYLPTGYVSYFLQVFFSQMRTPSISFFITNL